MTSRDTKAEDEHEHKDGAKRKTHDDEYADDNGGDADRRGDEEIRKLRTKTNTKTGRRRKTKADDDEYDDDDDEMTRYES